MDGEIVASGILPSFEFKTTRYAKEVIHWIKVTDKINLERRLPLYHKTLSINPSSNYFCILDNRAGHENEFTYPDIVALDEVLIAAGIECFYGATITPDPAYEKLVKLASFNAEKSRLAGELLATQDPAEAETFIMEKITSLAG